MVFPVENRWQGVFAACCRVPLGLRHPVIQTHLLAMLCLNVQAGKAHNIGCIARITAVLGCTARIIAVLPQAGGKLPFKACALLLAVYCHRAPSFHVPAPPKQGGDIAVPYTSTNSPFSNL